MQASLAARHHRSEGRVVSWRAWWWSRYGCKGKGPNRQGETLSPSLPGSLPGLSLSLSVSLARGKLVPATHARTSALALHAHTHGARTHARLASVARTLCPPARPPARDIGRLSHRLQVQGGRRAPDTAGAGARQLYFGCGFGTAASV